MKAIKIFCENCNTLTYSVIAEPNTYYLCVRCSDCGKGICFDEKDIVNIEETWDISGLVNKVGD